MSSAALHLLHTRPNARLLAAWVARHHRRHERQPSDLGDALHGLLCAAFGANAPQPFRYLDERQGLLAYTTLDADAMRAQVALADRMAARTLGLDASRECDGYRLRPFPSQWKVGQILGFEVRVRPVLRTERGERDAFQHAWDQTPGTPPRRETVYVQWLRDKLLPPAAEVIAPWQGAVELLDDVHLAGFQLQRVVRRTQTSGSEPRSGRVIDGPDALLKGHLRVRDATAFAQLLARGVGRHRAFGYGMLLLSRAD